MPCCASIPLHSAQASEALLVPIAARNIRVIILFRFMAFPLKTNRNLFLCQAVTGRRISTMGTHDSGKWQRPGCASGALQAVTSSRTNTPSAIQPSACPLGRLIAPSRLGWVFSTAETLPVGETGGSKGWARPGRGIARPAQAVAKRRRGRSGIPRPRRASWPASPFPARGAWPLRFAGRVCGLILRRRPKSTHGFVALTVAFAPAELVRVAQPGRARRCRTDASRRFLCRATRIAG
jgi:hypothetical protein